MFCKYCGKENQDGKKFCKYCGKDISQKISITPAEKPKQKDPEQKEPSEQKSALQFEGINKVLVAVIAVLVVLVAVMGIVFVSNSRKNTEMTGEAEEVAIEEAAAEEPAVVMTDAAEVIEEAAVEPEPVEDEAEAEEYVEEDEENALVKNTDIHYYEVYMEDITWTEAYDRCRQNGGYLARIDSEEEYQVICDLLNREGTTGIAYIGGMRDSDSDEYRWINDDGAFYDYDVSRDEYAQYWLEGEPSYRDEVDGEEIEERYMSMLYRKAEGRWYWNDIADDVLSIAPNYYTGNISYICEYE